MNAADRAQAVLGRIDAAAARCGRAAAEVTLIAVSKGHGARAIDEVASAGVTVFGESYVQEWVAKVENVVAPVQWHFIGQLQTNKAREVVGRAALIHTVDRHRLLDEIGRRATHPQDVLIEVDLAGEDAKGGCAVDDVEPLVLAAAASDSVVPRGLMAIPPATENPEDGRRHFRALRELRDRVRDALGAYDVSAAERFVELSMGMSSDFEVAIEEGATLVRVGTAIFGEREYAR